MQLTKSDRRGVPIDLIFNAASSSSITGETVQFWYNNAGTLTQDAGQAAGTLVVAKLKYTNILSKLGDSVGIFGDKSLSFTSTAFTTEVNVGYVAWSDMDEMTMVEKLTYIAANYVPVILSSNGKYFVDYKKGLIFGIKASAQTTLTAGAYLTPLALSSSSGGSGTTSNMEASGQHSGALPQGVTGYLSYSGLQTNYIPLYIAQSNETVTKFRMASRVSNGAAHTDTYTVVKNGVDTTMVLTITNAASGSTVTNTVSLVEGDFLSIKVVTDAATAAQDVLASLTLNAT